MGLFGKRKDKKETIKKYLLSNGYVLHTESSKKEVYVNNLNVVQLINFKRVVFDIGEDRMFDVLFPPTITLFKFLIKNAEAYYVGATK